MYFERSMGHPMSGNLLADFDDVGITVVADHFEGRYFDEASIRKMKEPLYGNGRLRCDATISLALSELAWFYDSSRIEEVPCWDRLALEKMRKPLIGFTHYRVTPTTMPILYDLAWFHDGLLELESG